MRTNASRGFSLIEILITLGLLSSIAGLALFMSLSTYRENNLISERDLVIGLLIQARTNAMEGVFGAGHGFCFDRSHEAYSFFSGKYTGSDSEESIQKSESSKFDTGHDCGTPGEVIFSRHSGTTTATTLTISDATNSVLIAINSEGEIESL